MYLEIYEHLILAYRWVNNKITQLQILINFLIIFYNFKLLTRNKSVSRIIYYNIMEKTR